MSMVSIISSLRFHYRRVETTIKIFRIYNILLRELDTREIQLIWRNQR